MIMRISIEHWAMLRFKVCSMKKDKSALLIYLLIILWIILYSIPESSTIYNWWISNINKYSFQELPRPLPAFLTPLPSPLTLLPPPPPHMHKHPHMTGCERHSLKVPPYVQYTHVTGPPPPPPGEIGIKNVKIWDKSHLHAGSRGQTACPVGWSDFWKKSGHLPTCAKLLYT